MNKLKNKDLLSIADLSKDEIGLILRTAMEIKRKNKKGQDPALFKGRVFALIFQKPSMRTRVSFEVGVRQMGGDSLFLTGGEMQPGQRETVADIARVLSRYVSGIIFRTFAQRDAEELARCATVPVVNALTDREHPCQVLADLLTVREHGIPEGKMKVCFVGDGNNVANSWALLAAIAGIEFTLACPNGYECPDDLWRQALRLAGKSGAVLRVTHDPADGVRGCNVIYTDTWTSMGQEQEARKRLKAFRGFQVNDALVRKARPGALVLHCLPAHRGEEITDSVMDGRQSVVFDEAENRLHIQKAILALLVRR